MGAPGVAEQPLADDVAPDRDAPAAIESERARIVLHHVVADVERTTVEDAALKLAETVAPPPE